MNILVIGYKGDKNLKQATFLQVLFLPILSELEKIHHIDYSEGPAKVHGVDIQEDLIVQANDSIETLQLSEEKKGNISFSFGLLENFKLDEKFDYIIASEVLEHIRDIELFVDKCKELLKPNGCILISTPVGHACDSFDHLNHFMDEAELLKYFKEFTNTVYRARPLSTTKNPVGFFLKAEKNE